MTLENCKRKKTYKIIKITGELKIKRRLLDLGFLIGEKIEILNISPLKKTFLISIKGYVLAIRNKSAKCLEIEEI